MKRTIHALLTLALLSGFAESANAAFISTRPQLQILLGGPGTLEDFEAFSVANGNAFGLFNNSSLDASSIVDGQGPGLVVPGVSFTFGSGGLQWDGAGYFGAPSREILSGSPAGQPLGIDFSVSVTAFGVDLRAFTGFGATATMLVYASDDTTLIGTMPGLALPNTGIPVFAGWEDVGGIGRIELTQTGQQWSPIIDNLEFGGTGTNVVPAPSALVLLFSAAPFAGYFGLRRRKRAVAV